VAVPVLVSHRHGTEPRAAVRIDDVVVADEVYPRHAGPRRYFWLLEYGVQLVYEPFGWQDEWYVDVVAFEHGRRDGREAIAVTDLMIDLVVEGMGPTYRIVDLDELASALGGGLGVEATAAALRSAQLFLDAFLHRGAPFPPPAVAPWFSADHRYPALPPSYS
jgi:predicted RNA-binding protein associated with RNAse of E/G family